MKKIRGMMKRHENRAALAAHPAAMVEYTFKSNGLHVMNVVKNELSLKVGTRRHNSITQ